MTTLRIRSIVGLAALTVALTASAVAAQACTPAHTFKTVADGKLTVAIYEYPPFSTASSDGKIGGVDGEIAKKFAEKNCLTVVAAVVDPAATIQYVLSGKADLAAGDWYRTAERAKVLGLSWPTYLDQMGIYSKTGYSKVEDLVGKKVGTVSGFLWVADLQKLLGSNLKLYQNPVALAQDLEAGRIDVAVDSFGTGAYAQKKGGYAGIIIKVAEPDPRVQSSIQAAQANLLYTKANADLGKALDASIQELHKSGELKEILKANGLDPSGTDVGEPRVVN
ncbi:polar amino acid transport system substrate-binding protein [Angulomicrobium tetraedrale]|uniref:Polar amino acid transport system substrate-binding protein n=1 Tax=Ancylobacter tetraedralis TaxID=217068 RepID=A0A839Z3H8_9HYPH|nr:transporter substrate-binding domain-containing protein [Ancylobacter tetraedralis]MBB3770179.1 polar amino acid transport system substrate-binding protein [Ancylobacter tetraedralis]